MKKLLLGLLLIFSTTSCNLVATHKETVTTSQPTYENVVYCNEGLNICKNCISFEHYTTDTRKVVAMEQINVYTDHCHLYVCYENN